jgi:hypothetical protein
VGAQRPHLRCSHNKAATPVGTPIAVAPPPSTDTVFKTAGEGSLGPSTS